MGLRESRRAQEMIYGVVRSFNQTSLRSVLEFYFITKNTPNIWVHEAQDFYTLSQSWTSSPNIQNRSWAPITIIPDESGKLKPATHSKFRAQHNTADWTWLTEENAISPGEKVRRWWVRSEGEKLVALAVGWGGWGYEWGGGWGWKVSCEHWQVGEVVGVVDEVVGAAGWRPWGSPAQGWRGS